LYVFPSEYEGFGLSMVEALACGLPAVVTDVGVAGELIQSGVSGLVVPPK
jgi:mannosyltransferase